MFFGGNLHDMLLGARFLANVNSVNSFDVVDKVEFSEGDPVTVYFQLVDKSLDRAEDGWKPHSAGRRYIPASGASLQVVILNLDSDKTYTKTASQTYPTTDPSIWAFTISATDSVRGTPNLRLVLTEGSTVRRALLPGAVRVYPTLP